MSPGYRSVLGLSFKAVDLLALAVAFDLAAGALFLGADWYSLQGLFDVRLKASNLLLFAALVAAWWLIFTGLGLYRSHRLASDGSEAVDVLKAVSLGSVPVLGAATLLSDDLPSPEFIGAFWPLATGITLVGRLSLRATLEWFRLRGRNLRNLLIVGTSGRAIRFAELVEQKRALGYQIKGFVDDEWSGIERFRSTGRELVSSLGGFDSYLRQHVVDEVVIALPVSSYYAQFSLMLNACEEQGILVHMLPDFFDLRSARLSLELLEDYPVITLRTGAMEGWPVLVKRVFDVAVSLSLLVLLAPLLVVVAILIKLSSPGSVLFVQERVGLNKRPFRFLKFRTMVADAERRQPELEVLNEASGPVFKIAKDPRTTRLGAILRRTSIDELPQLLNVLRGEMSLVGPRPLPLRDYRAFDADWHRRRFSVRPGMTCLWQVAGRTSIPFERWMELDMQYIDHWSLWLDVKILVSTLPAVMSGRGAS